MKIPRISIITLGVADLKKATSFYEAVLETIPNTASQDITFIELPGTWISLYPFANLAHDISLGIPTQRNGFSGFTLAHNARSMSEVIAVIDRARAAGACVVKEPQETFWGGFSGYFSDLDGYFWEVAWGPMFEISDVGELRFKHSS